MSWNSQFLQYFGYINIMRKRHSVKVEALGPTSDASQQHVLRIYYQVQAWRKDHVLDPLKWGWQLTKWRIMSIKMTKQVAPPKLWKTVKCGCKTDCTQKNCTCRQYGVVCTNICSSCMGVSCMNFEPINDTDPWWKHFNLSNFYLLVNRITANRIQQRRIQKLVRHLRWNLYENSLTVLSC